ncbi:hypothetical protein MGYG_04561 [Nannizzia gypsea CBS 118893]|uniref:DUF7136 domain-containing protein n=1 Tax=Arthroderma gypseum (strain ATCC MYA-4604 / CBS 118893) TaxID=535722 RepID=E4UTR6_ARTGP|nr:hypothetical protein MGYG_04561 [Nannizzia gypsea CBS 118893]EFR01559.1 hypothetical protein MGYG_04561 [Nannizzia gypsea CBS 118893]
MDAPTPTFPQIVEMDLIFPRNDTYESIPLMPVVFAIQNFYVSKPLFLRISYSLEQNPYINGPNVNGHLYLDNADFHNDSDPYFLYSWTHNYNTTVGTWNFIWEWSVGNCSSAYDPAEPFEPLHIGNTGGLNYLRFTTKHGAKMPDLAAASQDGHCDKLPAHTFNITEVLEVPLGTRYYNNQPSCPALSTITPTPNPCRVKIDPTAASSISYAIQSKACVGGSSPYVTCPPGVELWSSARGAAQLLPGAVLLVAIFAWVVLMIESV